MKKNKHKNNYTPPLLEEEVIVEEISPEEKQAPFIFFVPWRFQALFIFILAIIVYSNTLVLDYNLDDGIVITGNKYTKQGVSGIKDILTHDTFVGYFGEQSIIEGGRFRPLTQILFAIEYQIFGLNPVVGHFGNILFYALTCVILYFLLKYLFASKSRADELFNIPFVATLLYVTHPLHTEVVANIKGLDEIWSLLGSLIVLYLSVKYIEQKKIIFLSPIPIVFFLTLLSKENAITFFAIVPLTFFVFTSAKVKDYTIVISLMIVGFIGYVFVRYNALGFFTTTAVQPELMNNPFLNCTTSEKFATIIFTWGKYLLLLIFPHPLTHDYYPKQIEIIDWTNIKVIISLLIYTALLIFALIKIWKKNIIAYAILFFFFTFSIVSNIILPVGTFMNERFMFAPMIGFCLIVAYLLVEKLPVLISNTLTYKNMLVAFLVVITLVYSVKTMSRNLVWKDGYTLFTTDVKTSSNSAKCNLSAAGLILDRALTEKDSITKNNMLKQAVTYLEKATTVHPLYLSAWLVLGRAEIELKNYSYSALALENGLKINPANTESINNLSFIAQTSYNQKNYIDAIKYYKIITTYQPSNLTAAVDLGKAYDDANLHDSALIVFNKVLTQDSTFAPAYIKLSEHYGKIRGNIDMALQLINKALLLDPKNPTVLENLGVIYGIKGKFQESINYFLKAIEITPKNAQLYSNIATSYRNMGQNAKAEEFQQKAMELKK